MLGSRVIGGIIIGVLRLSVRDKARVSVTCTISVAVIFLRRCNTAGRDVYRDTTRVQGDVEGS